MISTMIKKEFNPAINEDAIRKIQETAKIRRTADTQAFYQEIADRFDVSIEEAKKRIVVKEGPEVKIACFVCDDGSLMPVKAFFKK